MSWATIVETDCAMIEEPWLVRPAQKYRSEIFGPNGPSIPRDYGVDALADEACRRGLRTHWLGIKKILVIDGPQGRWWLQGTITHRTSSLSVAIAASKSATKAMLRREGLPTPAWTLVRTTEEAEGIADASLLPLVAKPNCGAQGRGVTLDVRGSQAMRTAYQNAAQYGRDVLIEHYLPARDFRLLIIDGVMVAAAERLAPSVLGDGVSTIAELVTKENSSMSRGEDHERALTRISLDSQVSAWLARSKLSMASVLALGERVHLRGLANLSQGACARDCTDAVSPEVRLIAERAAALVRLDIAGIDVIASDLERPIFETGLQILEVNASPGLRMHLSPNEGASRAVEKLVLDYLERSSTPILKWPEQQG